MRDVTRTFGRETVVDALDLELQRGQVVGLLGPNGAGKSTTVRMLLGLLVPTRGTVELLGGPPDLSRRRRVGFLPEQRALYERMRALDQLIWFGRMYDLSAAEARRRAQSWLDRLGLGDRGHARISELSKGMQQRVQLGVALIHEPEVAVLDEPYSGLDPVSREVFAEVIREQARRGAAVLVVTHELLQAQEVCDRVVVLIHGRKVVDDDLPTLRRRAGGGAVRVHGVPAESLAGPEVLARMEIAGGGFELTLAPGVQPRWVLDRALGAGVVPERFEIASPSLQEIVVDLIKVEWTGTP